MSGLTYILTYQTYTCTKHHHPPPASVGGDHLFFGLGHHPDGRGTCLWCSRWRPVWHQCLALLPSHFLPYFWRTESFLALVVLGSLSWKIEESKHKLKKKVVSALEFDHLRYVVRFVWWNIHIINLITEHLRKASACDNLQDHDIMNMCSRRNTITNFNWNVKRGKNA